MADHPRALAASPQPIVFSTHSPNSLLWDWSVSQGGPSTGAVWPSANLAIYVPVWVEKPVLVTKMATQVTATAAGNVDVGIYDIRGNRLVSAGSTAVGGVGAQVFDVADTFLNPGTYYLAMNVSTVTTVAYARTAMAASYIRACGLQQQAVGAVALPATATFATYAQAYQPFIAALTTHTTI